MRAAAGRAGEKCGLARRGAHRTPATPAHEKATLDSSAHAPFARSGSVSSSLAQNASPRLPALWRSGSFRLSLAQNASRGAQNASEWLRMPPLALWRSGSIRLNVAQNAPKWLTFRPHPREPLWSGPTARRAPPHPDAPPPGCPCIGLMTQLITYQVLRASGQPGQAISLIVWQPCPYRLATQ